MRSSSEMVIGALIATAILAVSCVFVRPNNETIAVWKDFAGPLSTLVAAIAAGWVAYRLGKGQIAVAQTQADIARRNWETANEKVVLDLFERRLAIYEAVRDVIGEITRTGAAPAPLFNRYCTAIDRAPYFFGKDVQDYLENIRTRMADLDLSNTMMESSNGTDGVNWAEKRSKQFVAVTRFYEEAPPIFEPYIRAHQKAA